MTHVCHLGLGSNLGDRRAILDAAVAALGSSAGVGLVAVSPYLETAPVGGPEGQGAFLNAAATIETSLEPLDVLRLARRIEREAGRVRRVRWGERTLDVDLLLFDEIEISTPELTIPHPWMALRRFVLAPLARIAPEAVHPTTGRTVGQLLEALDLRRVALLGWPNETLRELTRRVPEDWTIVTERDRTDLTFAAVPEGVDVSREVPRSVPVVVASDLDDLEDVFQAAF